MILLTQTSQANSWPSKIDMKLKQKYFVLVGIAVLLSFHVISNVKYAQADVILLPEEEGTVSNLFNIRVARNTRTNYVFIPVMVQFAISRSLGSCETWRFWDMEQGREES